MLLAFICFMSVLPSFNMEQIGSQWKDFHEIWRFGIFRKRVEKLKFYYSLKWITINLHMKTYIHCWSYLAQFFLEWDIFRTWVVEKIKTHFMFNFFKSFLLCDNVEKYCTSGHTTDANMAHVLCIIIPKSTNKHPEYIYIYIYIYIYTHTHTHTHT